MVGKIMFLMGVVLLAACTAQPQAAMPEATGLPMVTPTAMATFVVTPTVEATYTPEIIEETAVMEKTVVAEVITAAVEAIQEFPVTEIALAGPLSNRNAEISGMAWYGDLLILLPQYPHFAGDGYVYALPKAEIEAYLMTEDAEPLTPLAIPMNDAGLSSQIDGFEGYEAITFAGDVVYLTIEANTKDGMRGYLVAGQIAPDLSELVVETAVITEILPQTNQVNHSDETLLIDGETLITIYETNGVIVNESPEAHRFNLDLSALDTVPLPNIEYRVTDATDVDENGRFWVINYFFPGDTALQTETDALGDKYGWGATHLVYNQVERLVELQLTDDGISFTDTPPLLLELPSDDARNWEGIVRLNNGFLVATDKFPKTILGYVKQNK